MTRGAYLMNLGQVGYHEAWELQRSLAAAVAQGAIPDTVLLLEHPPTITLGRRTEAGEVHIPAGVAVELVETDRGGKSTYHGPGQLVCYPILDLNRHGKDVKLYCRNLEEAIIRTVAPFGVEATRIDGLTGVWLALAAAEDRLDRRPHLALGHDARLRAQRRPRPGAVHRVDHGLRARRRGVHDARARDRPAGHGRRRPATGGRRARRGVRADARRAPGSRGGTVAAAAPRAARRPLIQRIPVSIAKLRLWLPARTVTCAGWIRMPADARTA